MERANDIARNAQNGHFGTFDASDHRVSSRHSTPRSARIQDGSISVFKTTLEEVVLDDATCMLPRSASPIPNAHALNPRYESESNSQLSAIIRASSPSSMGISTGKFIPDRSHREDYLSQQRHFFEQRHKKAAEKRDKKQDEQYQSTIQSIERGKSGIVSDIDKIIDEHQRIRERKKEKLFRAWEDSVYTPIQKQIVEQRNRPSSPANARGNGYITFRERSSVKYSSQHIKDPLCDEQRKFDAEKELRTDICIGPAKARDIYVGYDSKASKEAHQPPRIFRHNRRYQSSVVFDDYRSEPPIPKHSIDTKVRSQW
eukprot:TRINITY_DN6841_c0_g1_i1.p1 TRINITY_DN6841_c0_g1~~TRINITY_DN6841_c0_g1_i1.p1  ORF type:complete len:314 (-),score=57.77 TRINITY_DN6841_c0_g1_i1:79-1020(-)